MKKEKNLRISGDLPPVESKIEIRPIPLRGKICKKKKKIKKDLNESLDIPLSLFCLTISSLLSKSLSIFALLNGTFHFQSGCFYVFFLSFFLSPSFPFNQPNVASSITPLTFCIDFFFIFHFWQSFYPPTMQPYSFSLYSSLSSFYIHMHHHFSLSPHIHFLIVCLFWVFNHATHAHRISDY